MEKKSAYLRLCCFLTGLSYSLTRISSEQSVKNAKKYMGALLIIMLVWFFIGYCFATRYLHMSVVGGIILSHSISLGGKVFRVILGLVMAILGAMIMDQFTFQDDIELRKVQVLETRAKEAIKNTENDFRLQVDEIDSVLKVSNARLFALSEELQKRPVIVTNYTTSSITKDSLGNNINSTTRRNTSVMDNPLKVEFDFLQSQITDLNSKKFELVNSLTDLKRKKEEELKSSTGFLDELTLLKEVIASNWVGMFVYFLFLFFFLSLELFILIMKLSDKESDYDKLVDHQMNVRIQMLQRLKA